MLALSLTNLTEDGWTFSPQKGSSGRCLIAQVWDRAGNVIADINSTDPAHFANKRARLIAASPELLEACRLHALWADSEKAGPQYPEGVTRDNGGEAIWRKWWDANLDLCERAQNATRAAIAKAVG